MFGKLRIFIDPEPEIYMGIVLSHIRIDYKKKAEEWMKPLIKGQPTGMVEIPGSWYIDDLPPMMFMKNSANSHGWVNPRFVRDAKYDYVSGLITSIGMLKTYGVTILIISIASTTSSSSR